MIINKGLCDSVVEHVSVLTGTSVTTDPKYWRQDNTEYREVFKLWDESNFNNSSIKWINYYPDIELVKDFESELCDKLNVRALRSWVSRIDPGYYAPRHYDIDDKEQEYLKEGSLIRYTVFIDKPELGHIFILNDKHYYNIEQGAILEWPNYRDWHTGINGGLKPYYMFHLLCVSRAL